MGVGDRRMSEVAVEVAVHCHCLRTGVGGREVSSEVVGGRSGDGGCRGVWFSRKLSR